VRISGREPGFARLTSLVSGVVKIEQIDPSSINRMVKVTFGDGSTAWLEPTQADIDAAQDALAHNAARREGQATNYGEFMRDLTDRRAKP
jgi:hypothetical protein